MSACHECDGAVPETTGVEIGEILPCPECNTDLEVRSVKPLKLTRAPEEEEDWGE